jgi:uncharacterized protein
MAKRFVVGPIVAAATAGAALAGPYDDGVAALSNGDYATARTLWQPLAEQGDARAQSQLGLLYFNGRGVPRDYAQALIWFNRAAAQHDGNAEYNLALMYHDGDGVPRDDSQADQWYELAADQGLVPAQGNLGYMYATGQGVPRDYVIALMWFTLAAAGGDATAAQNALAAAAQLSPSDIAKAQHLARAWKPTRPR